MGQLCMCRGGRCMGSLCTFCSILLLLLATAVKKKTLKKEKTKTNKQQVHKPDLAEASLLTPQLAAGNAQIVKIWFSIHTSCTQHIFTEYLLLSVDETAV